MGSLRSTCLLLVFLCGCTEPGVRADALGNESIDCANCHQQQYDEWSQSPHQTSGTSEGFEALRAETAQEHGERAGQNCTNCHQPNLTEGQNISCLTCHGATGNFGTKNGRLSVDLALPIAGPTGMNNYAHEVRTAGFLLAPELCGTCHQVEQPGLFEPTFEEFEQYQSLGGEASCVDCHMRNAAGEVDHSFFGPDRNSMTMIDRLKAGVSLTISREDPEQPGRALVTIHNHGIGHSVPTGVAHLRAMWVEVAASGEASQVVLSLDDAPLAPGESRTVAVQLHAALTARLYRRTLRTDITGRLNLPTEAAQLLIEMVEL